MNMIEFVIALAASFFLASGIVEARRGLENSDYEPCILILTLIGFIILTPITIFTTDFSRISLGGVIMFLLAGVLNPGLSRLFFYKSVEKVGAVLTSSITPSSPIISAMLAVIILQENPWTGLWLGVACIVVGSILIEIGSHENSLTVKGSSWILLPIMASLVTGLNDVVRKQALIMLSQPLLGTTLAYVATLSLYTIVFSLEGKLTRMVNVNNLRLFWRGGVFLALGQLLSFYALNLGKVLEVSPLIYTQPFFVFILTTATLKKVEKVSWKPLLGSVTMILGIVFLSIK